MPLLWPSFVSIGAAASARAIAGAVAAVAIALAEESRCYGCCCLISHVELGDGADAVAMAAEAFGASDTAKKIAS